MPRLLRPAAAVSADRQRQQRDTQDAGIPAGRMLKDQERQWRLRRSTQMWRAASSSAFLFIRRLGANKSSHDGSFTADAKQA